jgi:hypothetical protein
MQKLLHGWLLLVLILAGQPAQAQTQLAIVVSKNSHIQQLDAVALQAVFLGMITQDKNLRTLKPVDVVDETTRDFFYQQLVGRNRNQMRSYWSRMSFTGRGGPPQEMTVNELIVALESNPLLIAYIPKDLVNDQLKILMFIP